MLQQIFFFKATQWQYHFVDESGIVKKVYLWFYFNKYGISAENSNKTHWNSQKSITVTSNLCVKLKYFKVPTK